MPSESNDPRASVALAPLVTQALDQLAALSQWTYGPHQASASEPASIAALALAAHNRGREACVPGEWLAQIQQADGAVGVSAAESVPYWPTSLAIHAWSACDAHAALERPLNRAQAAGRFADPCRKGVAWALEQQGEVAPQKPQIGHDTTLVGWPWAEHTHSWLEPTCFFVMALKAAGYAEHPRTREGVRMIADRLLASGGANYGNTSVLGQQLLPHVQPTGIALMALAGESINDPRLEASLQWLAKNIDADTPSASLSYALLGLTAWGRRPDSADRWIEGRLALAVNRPLTPYRLALLLWAAAPRSL